MRKLDLGKDKPLTCILKLALPVMLSQFVAVLYSIVDRMYIGHIASVGSLALAGVGVAAPILTLISSFGSLVGFGGAPIAAMSLGENDSQKARRILSNCLIMLLVISAVLYVVVYAFKNPLLLAFGATESNFLYANRYLSFYVIGTLFALLYTGLQTFLVCQGRSFFAMAAGLVGAALNIALDPVFIFVFDLGVEGAAIATVISQAASAGVVIYGLLSKNTTVKLSFGGYSFKIIKRVIVFGLSPFIIYASDSIILIVLNGMLKSKGGANADTLIAVNTVVQSFMLLISMPMGGITSGTQPYLSFNYGAGGSARIKQGERVIALMCVCFTAFMTIVAFTLPKYFAMLFSTDSEIIKMSAKYCGIYCAGIIPLALQYAFVDGLTGLGRVKTALSLSATRKITYTVLVIVLATAFGAEAAFYSEPITDTFAAIITSTVFLTLLPRILKRREGDVLLGKSATGI